MSRIGKQVITIPKDTTVTFDGTTVSVKGPKGELSRRILPDVSVSIEGDTVTLAPATKRAAANVLWGTYVSHIQNMITGVTEGYEKKLVVEGVGYKAALEGNTLVLNVGFSHPIHVEVPEGLSVSVEKDTEISIVGIDKELVGQFAATVRAKKKPEPYKGKGVRYENEVVRRKEGKKAA